MGISSKKTKTTSSQTGTSSINSTVTPTAPDYVSEALKKLTGTVTDLGAADPASYVAGSNPLIDKAATGAAGLTGSPWNFDGALDLTRGVAAAAAPQTKAGAADGYIDNYLNPYLSQVVDATKADLSANADQVRAQQDLDLAGSGAFGGSGAALTKSATEGELSRGIASSLGALRSQGYDTALGAAQQDATRAQSANDLNAQLKGQGLDRTLNSAGQIADISSAFDANNRANQETQINIGDVLRQIQQSVAGAPLNVAQGLSGILSQLPLNLVTGQQTSGTTNTSGTATSKGTESGASLGDWLEYFAANAKAAASAGG